MRSTAKNKQMGKSIDRLLILLLKDGINSPFLKWRLLISGGCILLTACQKTTFQNGTAEPTVSPLTGSRFELTLDSVYLYAKQVYLWNDVLPDYNAFNPRTRYHGISPDLVAYQTELFDLSQLKINPVSGSPFEYPVYEKNPKYSYLSAGAAGSESVAELPDGERPVILASGSIPLKDKQIGYVALGSFPALSVCKEQLDRTFLGISKDKPDAMVIDLRYNPGGFIETAQYVADLIAGSELNGKVMYSEQFNRQMQDKEALILRHQPYVDDTGHTVIYQGRKATMADVDYSEAHNTYHFNKKGALEKIKEVCFIVSGNTASASELLISCLKPYYKVTLVGEKTYGKPVGFFGINIDKYTIHLASFVLQNANGWSDYYHGMNPDIFVKSEAAPVFGDPDELCLRTALAYLNGAPVDRLTGLSSNGLSARKQDSPAKPSIPVSIVPMVERRLQLRQ
jgi:hypothetical protein